MFQAASRPARALPVSAHVPSAKLRGDSPSRRRKNSPVWASRRGQEAPSLLGPQDNYGAYVRAPVRCPPTICPSRF